MISVTYIVAYVAVYSHESVCHHFVDSPTIGLMIHNQIVLAGRLENVMRSLDQIEVSSLKKGGRVDKHFYLSQQNEYVYQVSVATGDMDVSKPLCLNVVLGSGERYVLAEIFIGRAESINRLLTLARSILTTGDFATCRAVCEKILATCPDSRAASVLLTLLTGMFVEGNESGNVVKNCQVLLALNLSNEVFSHEEIANLAQKYKQWEVALAYWNECLSRTSQIEADWLSNKGAVLIALQRYDEAKRFFQATINFLPSLPVGHVGLAYVAHKQGDIESALALWDRCIQLFPNEHQQLWLWKVNKAEILLANDNIEEAREIFEQLTVDYPDNYAGYVGLYQMARIYYDWLQALDYLELCLEKFPHAPVYTSWLLQKADILLRVEKYQEAKQIFRSFVENFPEETVGYTGLINIEKRLGNWDTVIENLNHCLIKFPKNKAIVSWFSAKAQAFIELSNRDASHRDFLLGEAEYLLKHIIVNYPNSQIGYVGLANLAQLREDWSTALDYWNTCLAQFPEKDPLTWLEAKARVLIQLGCEEEVESLFRPLIEDFFEKQGIDLANC